jgi:hypothetical protein
MAATATAQITLWDSKFLRDACRALEASGEWQHPPA